MLFSRVCLGERREQWESIRLFFLVTKVESGNGLDRLLVVTVRMAR